MKKLFLPLALVVSLVFSACNDISTDSGSERLLFGNKAYLTCSVDDIARKVSPVNVTKLDIVKVELLYKKTSGSGEATLLHEWEAECDTDDSGAKTITKNAVDVMTEETSKNPLDIDAGTYDFTLKLYVRNSLDTDESVLTQVGTITAKEIKAGENALSFNTKYTDGNGTLDVKLSWVSGMPVAKVQAGLFSVNAETLSMGAEVEGFGLSDVELIDDSARYAKSVPTGMYYLKFNVYQEETDDEPINSWSDLVKIISGATTSKEVTLSSSNVRYSINYVLNVGEEGSWKDGFTPVEKRNVNTGVILPTAANIVPPSWYVFAGWYAELDSETGLPTGEKVEAIDTGDDTAKDYTLYAKWVPEMDSASIEVSIDINPESDIEVVNDVTEAVKNSVPQITFTAPTSITVTVDGEEQEKAIETYVWKLDGVEVEVPEATPNILTLDTTAWATGVYDVLLKATDEDGNYYSYLAQVEWTRLYKITFNTDGAPDGTATVEPQYISERGSAKVTQPTDVVPPYGWYSDSAFTKPYDFTVKPKRSMTIYGCWKLISMYVGADGSDPTDDDPYRGTADKPLATIAGAVAMMDDENKDYIVYIDGEITGAQTIGVTDGSQDVVKASSITLTGKTGNATDILNGGCTAATPGSALTIGTGVDIKIKNLSITGGYNTDGGGINILIGYSPSVTIGDGTKIYGNTATHAGAGVYLPLDSGMLFMVGGEISGNTVCSENGGQGGGVYAGSEFFMGGGVIKGNSALNDETGSATGEYGGLGGGVYVAGNMYMYGNAVVGDNSQTSAATVDSYSNIANCGGGVYVTYFGSLYMGYSLSDTKEDLYGGIYYNYAKYTAKETVNASGCGGGVYLHSVENSGGAVLNMDYGEIKGNACGSAYHGSGVYVAAAAEGVEAKFNMGGDTLVSEENDVYLTNGTAINITSELNFGPVARITPEDYSSSPIVLTAEDTELFERNYDAFVITPNGSNYYVISIEGVLTECNVIAETVSNYIQGMTASGTVRVGGEIDSGTIEEIRSALRNLYVAEPEVEVSLDLSYTTGLTELNAFAFGVNGQNGGCYSLVSLILPEGLVKIEELAFKDCSNLALLSLPSTLETIVGRTFYGCTSLSEIEFPNGNDSFIFGTDKALYSAYGARLVLYCGIPEEPDATLEFTVPAAVEVIGDYAFQGSKITAISFESDATLKTIETDAFYECSRLTAIDIPDSVDSIEGECAFAYCESLANVGLPASLTELDCRMCFYHCKALTEIAIPEGVTVIGYSVFGDSVLQTVTLPSTLEEIGEGAFHDCPLTEITFPASLTTIGNRAFSNCTELTTVYYKGTEEQKGNISIGSEDNDAIADIEEWIIQ